MKFRKAIRKRVICIGLGPIGVETCRLIEKTPGLKLVGLVDRDPRKVGKYGGFGLMVQGSIEDCVWKTKPDVAFLMTSSRVASVIENVRTLLRLGVDVVSSCEELAFPWLADAQAARALDLFARRQKCRVVGTGVNPGFVMDALPLNLASVCQDVESIRVLRIVDVSKRRLQLQRKMAVGISTREFAKRLRKGEVGHAGLKESVALIAWGMGWKLQIRETIRPLVKRNRVVGMAQMATGTAAGHRKVVLELNMSWGAKDPRDEVHVIGKPPVHATIRPGIQGDWATAARLIHASWSLEGSPYGVRTVIKKKC